MNWIHRRLCASRPWRTWLARDLLPWALSDVTLGDDVLEIGPGPGAATDILAPLARRLTCVEIDSELARALAHRLTGRNVAVHCGDASSLPLPDRSFDTVLCLMVLHHVAPASRQDRLFAEVGRVLRPGGTFIVLESQPGLVMRGLHIRDTFLCADPRTIDSRLVRAGFDRIRVDVRRYGFRVHASVPAVTC